MRRKNIHDLLEEARSRLSRLSPAAAHAAARNGARLIDVRSDTQRREQGVIPSAHHQPLSELEWTLDPESGFAEPDVTLDTWIILICYEGYSSSLAAARLHELGFKRATDVIDGVVGWARAGLPLNDPPT